MPRTYPIHEKAPERPFKCIVSGLAGPVVDLEKFVEGYGRVYIHVNVVAAIAQSHGFITDREADALRATAAEATEEASRLPAVLEGFLSDVRDAADRARVRAAGGTDSLGASADDAVEDTVGVAGEPALDGDAAGEVDRPAGDEEPRRLPAGENFPFHQPDVFSE